MPDTVTANAAVTELSKLGVGFADPVTVAMNHKEFKPGVNLTVKDTNGVRGTLFKDSNRFRENRVVVKPHYIGTPSAPEWAFWLQHIMGGTPDGTSYPWSNTTQTAYMFYQPISGDIFFLSGVGANKSTLKASSGEDLTLDVECLGQLFTNSHASYPAISYDLTLQPFILSDLVLSYNAATVACREFSLMIDRKLSEDRYLNSLTLTDVVSLDSDFQVTFDIPSGENGAGAWEAGIAGITIVATFTGPGTEVLTITLNNVVCPPQSPEFAFKSEGFIRIQGTCCRSSATPGTGDPVIITLHQ